MAPKPTCNGNTNGLPTIVQLPDSSGSNGGSPTLLDIIRSNDPEIRNRSLTEYCENATTEHLLKQCELLESFRHSSDNLYETVRACFFLYAIHRFHLRKGVPDIGTIPYEGYQCLQQRHFAQAIDIFLRRQLAPNQAISSALAQAYHNLGLQLLADQVKVSVRSHPGNQWMFDTPHSSPYRMRPELLDTSRRVLQESTPVRMDLSHCGWSDIFFLGMDFPEGARVLNISIDLAVHGSPAKPPIDCFLTIIDQPVLKLSSVDLKCQVTLTRINQVFEFGQDYLGLLRAGIIASGIVPFGLEHSTEPLSSIFDKLIGPNKGLHLTTRVNSIPKGSRLAVSTNLLCCIIALGMRATGQTEQLIGDLSEEERRTVAARAILAEHIGGSGGGWQDSGGVWPGIKLIQGVKPEETHPEYGVSRGRLLPIHRQLSDVEAPPRLVQALQDHLVLVHGGMAQDVGPILEMVTEKYLLREGEEWKARYDALGILDDILDCFRDGDVPRLAQLTTRNFFEPIQTIIPFASNAFTETLISRTKKSFGEDFLGFWMLGGSSGGGMGFIFKPDTKQRAVIELQEIMLTTKRELETALPFAMDPVVYDFSINHNGTMAKWSTEGIPTVSTDAVVSRYTSNDGKSLDEVLQDLGFDLAEHKRIQDEYRRGVIGLSQNRLPLETRLENATSEDVIAVERAITPEIRARGLAELQRGSVGVVTLAAGVGSRWTQGAGCVKALHPFCKLDGLHRSFLEVHFAKSRRVSQLSGVMPLPHVITTSSMTDQALRDFLDRPDRLDHTGPLYVSKGRTIGLRLVPTIQDLQFSWQLQSKLDDQAQKVRESGHKALQGWVEANGEGSDYRDNLPSQCLHPVGHFYEVPNLLLNGTLQQMLFDRPQLQFLMLHNVDTVGADVDAGLLGLFLEQESTLAFEVVPRRIEDTGGGLARVNGTLQLVEGLAVPREEDEWKFTYYNSMTTWIHIDKLLRAFGLSRSELGDHDRVLEAVHNFSHRLPTYAALKDVKKRWGKGQEDIFLTAQFEKLWSDISSLDDVDCSFFLVPRERGNQLKSVSQLDGWLRDGSAAYVEQICAWE